MNDTDLRHEPFLAPPPQGAFPQGALLAQKRPKAGRLGKPGRADEPLPTPDGPAVTAMLARIKQLESQNRRLRHLSITDELTGAFNHRHFPASFAALVHLPVSPLPRTIAIALCLFDIDHFKAYNDAFGHPMGDAALRAISIAVRGVLRRESDRLFRFGGDEFGTLFLAATPEQAVELVEKFQAAINKLKLSHPTCPGASLSATFGIAWHPAPAYHGLTAKQLYSVADDTLYAAKQNGRNRILMRIMHDVAALP
ncbi:GGDEF domain-containing protein [Bordetella sp. BOR01]|uniref:GGDEF domain-containing protein n=1 Tax=Bordetella sp. BOR01 TaxID=2854779 RepID=UPI001C43E144|nr:GGDEF domain-containing protein [Bordetella sp. BOR01]MBV7486409.1 GGDEF domain-containing protein [Bordetella sp. BOR01]